MIAKPQSMSQLVILEMDVHALPIASTMVELCKPEHFGLSLIGEA